MANFTPSGIIRLGRVPFDNTYKHTYLGHTTAANQATQFATKMTASLQGGDYSYVRMNNAIRVAFNAEQLYTYNYCMYKNDNYGDKWFYAFITEINYLNENCTELVLELDVLQTWWYELNIKRCNVLREHVNDDTIGAHLNPEPDFDCVETIKHRTIIKDDVFDDFVLCVQTNAKPHYDPTFSAQPQSSDPIQGGVMSGVFNGCGYAFTRAEPNLPDSSGIYKLLEDMNKCGAAESITNMFMYPSQFLSFAVSGAAGAIHWLHQYAGSTEESSSPVVISRSTARPTSLDGGYSPRNNKLFTYPYCYSRLSDNEGNSTELRYELWSGFGFDISAGLDPEATAVIVPKNYMGATKNYEYSFNMPITCRCSWVYSAFETWRAQNRMNNLFGSLKAITSVIGAGTAAVATGGTAGLAMGASGGLNGIGSSPIGQWYSMKRHPNVQKGESSGNNTFVNNMVAINVDQVVIKEEFARIIDNFFDAYGYQVDTVKVPNVRGRSNWNYVLCKNSAHWGNIPAPDLSAINGVFDNGITFWHTWDIGNYSLSNSIVS